MTQRIVPTFWFQGNAEEAADFYADAFPCVSYSVPQRYPETGLPDFQKPLAGQPVVVELDFDGYEIILLNAGAEFSVNQSVTLMLYFGPKKFGSVAGATKAVDEVWAKLTADGTIVSPLDDYPWANHYGYVVDKFGLGWQVMVDAEDTLPFCGPSLMYSGDSQNKCAEAMAFYESVFPESSPIEIAMKSSLRETDDDGVMWGANVLWGQVMQYCDGYPDAPTFNEGVSLDVRCDTQEQIDQLWDALSADPAAEQCGWLRDKYGLSWQITVANMSELMNHKPGSWEKLMSMKKIVIADL